MKERGKTIRMYDYILQEEHILLDLLDNRKKYTDEFAMYMSSHEVREIVISGSGTSYHAALASRRFLEEILGLRVRAEYPFMIKDMQSVYDSATVCVGISQGGNSQSTMDMLDKMGELRVMRFAISENARAAVFDRAEAKALMEIGPELSVAKTKGYVATIAMLLMMGIEAAFASSIIGFEEYNSYLDRYAAVARNFKVIIPMVTKWIESIREELASARRIIVLGYKNNYANALEGALKLLETLRFGVYGYEIDEFTHGIYNSVDADTYIFYLVSEGEYKHKVATLNRVLNDVTKHQFIICGDPEGIDTTSRDCVVPFIDDPVFSVLEYILPTQIISATIPYDLGIDPFKASDPNFHSKVKSKVL